MVVVVVVGGGDGALSTAMPATQTTLQSYRASSHQAPKPKPHQAPKPKPHLAPKAPGNLHPAATLLQPKAIATCTLYLSNDLWTIVPDPAFFLYLLCISCPMDLQCPIKAVTINQ